MHLDSQDVTAKYCLTKKFKTGYQSTVIWFGMVWTAGGKYVATLYVLLCIPNS